MRQIRSLMREAPAVADDALRQAILDLGLEGDIPCGKSPATSRSGPDRRWDGGGVEALAQALLDLTRRDKIRILVGRWEIAADLERVHHVNVDNIAQ